jgi:hypothetical protein
MARDKRRSAPLLVPIGTVKERRKNIVNGRKTGTQKGTTQESREGTREGTREIMTREKEFAQMISSTVRCGNIKCNARNARAIF